MTTVTPPPPTDLLLETQRDRPGLLWALSPVVTWEGLQRHPLDLQSFQKHPSPESLRGGCV